MRWLVRCTSKGCLPVFQQAFCLEKPCLRPPTPLSRRAGEHPRGARRRRSRPPGLCLCRGKGRPAVGDLHQDQRHRHGTQGRHLGGGPGPGLLLLHQDWRPGERVYICRAGVWRAAAGRGRGGGGDGEGTWKGLCSWCALPAPRTLPNLPPPALLRWPPQATAVVAGSAATFFGSGTATSGPYGQLPWANSRVDVRGRTSAPAYGYGR